MTTIVTISRNPKSKYRFPFTITAAPMNRTAMNTEQEPRAKDINLLRIIVFRLTGNMISMAPFRLASCGSDEHTRIC